MIGLGTASMLDSCARCVDSHRQAPLPSGGCGSLGAGWASLPEPFASVPGLYVPPEARKRRGLCRPRLPFRFRDCDLVGQLPPGPAGKRIISVPVIGIEIICLVVLVSARCANVFMA